MLISHRTRRIGASLAMLALLSGTAAAQQTELNFLGESRPDIWEPVITAFEAANPGITVTYQQVPFDDLNAAVESRIGQGDSSIDLFLVDTPRVPAFASRGYLLEMEDIREKANAVVPNPVDIEQVSHEGKIYAYPMWTSTQLLYYNRDLLSAAGVEEPGAAEADRLTWDELLTRAKAAQDGGAEWGLAFQQFDRYYQLQFLFESAGAGPGLSGEGLLDPDITSEGWKQTAQWYADLFSTGLAPRGIAPNQTDDLFTNGSVAFMVGGPWVLGRYNEVETLNYGVAPVPYFADGKPATPTGSWAIAINPNAANLEEARKFADFATLTTEGAFLTAAANKQPLVNAEAAKLLVAEFGEMARKIGPVADIITYESQNTAVGRPRTVGFVAFETVMNRAFSDIRNGADVAETLEAAQAELQRTLARLRG